MAHVGKQIIKEGRHVGLDVYDLLREALMGLKPAALLDSGGGAESGAIPETIDEMSPSWMCFPRGQSRPELRRRPRVPVQIS
jgi:hypothetical protein